jgi:hypothetical protein
VSRPGLRFYYFVIGGSTPLALAADWVVSMLAQTLDQMRSCVPRRALPTRW